MRTALRLLTVAAALLVIGVLAFRPQQSESAVGAVGSLARVPASPQTLVCPAPPEEAAATVGTDPQFALAPPLPRMQTRAVSYARPPGAEAPDSLQLTTLPSTGGATVTEGTGPDQLAAATAATPHAVAVRATPAHDLPAGAAAVTSVLTAGGDHAGLAVAGCTPAQAAGYLVGGGVGPGRTSRLVLSNPGRTVVSVDLTVLTDTGPLEPATGQGLSIAPGSSRAFSLDVLAPDAQVTAVGFEAGGGMVGGALVDTVLHGLVPRGVDFVPITAPAEEQVLAPVTGPATLRLANPHPRQIEARWRAGDFAGPREWAEVSIPAGAAVDVPVQQSGPLSLTVVADQPVLAAARWVRERPGADPAAPAADLAWTSAGPALTAQGRAALPGGVANQLTLAAGTEPAGVSVRQLSTDGTPIGSDRPVAVPAGAIRQVDLDPTAVAAWLEVTSGPVHAGLASRAGPGGTFVSASAVLAPSEGQETTSVIIEGRPQP